LARCEARELPSDGELVELSLWSRSKRHNKANKWKGGRFVFPVGKGF